MLLCLLLVSDATKCSFAVLAVNQVSCNLMIFYMSTGSNLWPRSLLDFQISDFIMHVSYNDVILIQRIIKSLQGQISTGNVKTLHRATSCDVIYFFSQSASRM